MVASVLLYAVPAYACFADYYAPAFLDITDPTIGAGVIAIVVATVLAALRRNVGGLICIPILFLGTSYFGHWNYSGDCGQQIVQLNRVALVIAAVWFGFEALRSFRRGSGSTA